MRNLLDLPPWDQLQYYALPVETVVAVTTIDQLAIKGDPMRRFLAFCLLPLSTGALTVSTSPSAGGNSGIVINTTAPLILDYVDWGPLVNVPWYLSVTGAGSGNVTVISQSLIRWPDDQRPLSPLEVIDRAFSLSPPQRRVGVGAVSGFDSVGGAERAAREADDLGADIERCKCGPGFSRNGNDWLPPRSWRSPINP